MIFRLVNTMIIVAIILLAIVSILAVPLTAIFLGGVSP